MFLGEEITRKRIKRVRFLGHHCEDNDSYDYKPTGFYFAVTESDPSCENTVCDITSNKKIETCEFYSIIHDNIIYFKEI